MSKIANDTIAAGVFKLKQPCVSLGRQTNCRLLLAFPVHDMSLCLGSCLFATRGVRLRVNMILEPWKESFIKGIARLAGGLMDEPGLAVPCLSTISLNVCQTAAMSRPCEHQQRLTAYPNPR